MIKTVKLKKVIEQNYVDDIICNKCCKSLKGEYHYEGLTRAKSTGGYDSKIGDMVTWSFDLCEDCLLELFKQFKISPYEEENIESEYREYEINDSTNFTF